MKKMVKKKSDLTTTEKRKQQIIDAAIEVFSKKGFEGSTTKEIAKKAKVSEGTIFRYFKTKKDILIEILNILAEQTLSNFIERLDKNQDTKESVKNLLKEYYKFVLDNSELLRILIYEVQFHRDLKKYFNEHVLSKIIKRCSQVIKEAGYDGVDPDVAGNALCGALIGLIIVNNASKFLVDSVGNEEKMIDDIIDILLYGIKRKQ